MALKARKFITRDYLRGTPTLDDFVLVEETIEPSLLKDGEIIVRGICFSVDPYMRPFANKMSKGDVMPGSQVSEILHSKNPNFKVGEKVITYCGWRDISVVNPDVLGPFRCYHLPQIEGMPDTYALGSCGMPGMTAYFGFLDICQPKEGDTVVVNTAAGAVGSMVVQIAKIMGLKVIAFTGSEEKVKWLKEEVGIKFVFNYKEVHLDSILKKYAVEGVDCYFDNVGGDFTYTVMGNMNTNGRIALCGAISQYNLEDDQKTVRFDYFNMIYKELLMKGFLISSWTKKFPEGMAKMADWIKSGKIKVRETKFQGFEKMPEAFLSLFQGSNIGKVVVTA